MENSAFIDGKDKITTESLLETIKNTKSISSTMKEKIDKIRETIKKMDIKKALTIVSA